jgi:hypothetical protein
MAENYIIETMGTISKLVELESLKHKVIPGSLVLEALEPFPGYHHDVPVQPIPGTIYFITLEHYTRENITRIYQKVSKIVQKKFEAATGEISIYNDKYPCIRIHELENYDYIEEIQNCFKDYGIKYKKYKKIKATGISRIKKFYCIKEFEEGVYLDSNNSKMGYFKVDFLTWKLFEKITLSIKQNWEKAMFDAAIGTFYRKEEIQDIIRIYRDNISKEILLEIRKKYLDEIKKI